MRVASWNVNSIRPRLEHLTAWLARAAPDVVCLQETKAEDHKFPAEALADAGYEAHFTGQKTYNGVAILARFGLGVSDVKKNLDGDDEASQRRAIACTVDGIRIVCVYVPNGQAVGTPAFAYKLAWFERLGQEVAALGPNDAPVLVCGDFNVAHEPIDVYDPVRWEGQVLFHPDERAALGRLLDLGLVDVVRAKAPEQRGLYSYWDYRMGAFRRNQGLRIDLVLASRTLAEACSSAAIDRRPRELERPSDHAPVVVEFSL